MLAKGTADSIEAAGSLDTVFLQSVVDVHAEGRGELLNLYCGTKDSAFIQSNREAAIPEGYDPVQRGWYQQADAAGETIVTDPYWDVITGQMCTTIASPVYIDGTLAAVIGLDVTLGTVTDLTGSINYAEGAYGFLSDSSGQYVAHRNKEYEPSEDAAVAVTDKMPALKSLIEGNEKVIIETADYDGTACYFAASGDFGMQLETWGGVPHFPCVELTCDDDSGGCGDSACAHRSCSGIYGRADRQNTRARADAQAVCLRRFFGESDDGTGHSRAV